MTIDGEVYNIDYSKSGDGLHKRKGKSSLHNSIRDAVIFEIRSSHLEESWYNSLQKKRNKTLRFQVRYSILPEGYTPSETNYNKLVNLNMELQQLTSLV